MSGTIPPLGGALDVLAVVVVLVPVLLAVAVVGGHIVAKLRRRDECEESAA